MHEYNLIKNINVPTDAHAIHMGTFVRTTGAVFIVFVSILAYADLLPESPVVVADERSMPTYYRALEQVETPEDVYPRTLTAGAIGLTAPINVPESTELSVLDASLRAGIVWYPSSADLAGAGNVLIFGHSSSLPIVHNQNYKVFNRVHELLPGDTITIATDTHLHTYRVERVRTGKAHDVLVQFDSPEARLTLVTCNTSFGDASQRYIVEAVRVSRTALSERAGGV